LPFASKVAVCLDRQADLGSLNGIEGMPDPSMGHPVSLDMDPVELNEPVAGSYSSADAQKTRESLS
jgi:hypothetical protein